MEDKKKEATAEEVTAEPAAVESEPAAPAAKEKKASRSRTADAAKLEKLKKELEAEQDAYKRVLAEYANYQRRTVKE